MFTLLRVLTEGLNISGIYAILLIRKGAVYVDGIQRTDVVYKIKRPATVKITGHSRLWVTM